MRASAKLAVQKHALMLCADDTSGPAGSASDHRNHTSATGAALCPFMPETGAMTCLFNLEQDPSEPKLRPRTTWLAAAQYRLACRLAGWPQRLTSVRCRLLQRRGRTSRARTSTW